MSNLLSDRAACLACVEQSPQAVAAHDKARWLGLFAPAAVVEDPVGSRPVVNQGSDAVGGPIGRFYETFIAANDIRFHVQRDIVCGGCAVRDLEIEIRMSAKVVVRVPMHLIYELTELDGELKIKRLAAHWELAPMLRQQMQYGLASMTAGTAAFWRMLRYLGLSGVVGFAEARRTVGEPGRRLAQQFAAAFSRGDAQGLRRLFAGSGTVAWPAGQEQPAASWELPATPTELKLGKTLVAGNYVTASFSLGGSDARSGVLEFQLQPDGERIRRLRCFMEA